MVEKICCAALLTMIAGAASASSGGDCTTFLIFEICKPSGPSYPGNPGGSVKAPEIDPASAMAGLTLMAGGLAVLRGRRTKKTNV